MRCIGLDVHRDFCEVAIAEGGRVRHAGRIQTSVAALELFAGSLAPDDHVVLEATGPAFAIARILRPHVARVVVANAQEVRAISHARVKSDRFDAATLARLLSADSWRRCGSAMSASARCAGAWLAERRWSVSAPGPRTRCTR